MDKFINRAENVVSEMLDGLALAHNDLITVEGSLVINKKLADAQRVTVVAMGAAGNEPALSGFVGEGMIDIAVVGEIFAAPGPQACVDALRLADKGQGVLLVVLNHTGDRLTAELALRQAAKLGLRVRQVLVHDDVAQAPREQADERRGLLGCVPLCKIAGAAAAAGRNLAEVAAIAERFAGQMAAIGITSRAAVLPGAGVQTPDAANTGLQFGTGQHGEAGSSVSAANAEELAELMLTPLLQDLQPEADARLLVIVSGSGATTLMEQLIVYRSCHRLLVACGLQVAASAVGSLLTVFDAAGLQLFIAKVDDELLTYWQAACKTPYYKS